MIDINLIPQKFRKKKKKSIIPGGVNIPLEVVVGVSGALIVGLVFIHVIFAGINYSKLSFYHKLQEGWDEVLPMKQNVDVVINEMRKLQQKIGDLEKISVDSKLLWSKKINILSESLPNEMWIRKIALMDDMFLVEGSAISRQGQEMGTVLNFTSELKNHASFLENLKDLEVGSIYRRNIKKVEVADFIITINLEQE